MPTPRAGWLGAVLVLIAADPVRVPRRRGALRLRRRRPAVRVRGLARRRRRARASRSSCPWRSARARRGRASSTPDARARRPLRSRWCSAPPLNLSMFLAFDRTTVALALLGFYTYPGDGRRGERPARAGAARSRPRGRARASRSRAWSRWSSAGSARPRRCASTPSASCSASRRPAFQATFVLTSRGFAAVRADVAMGAILAGSALVAGGRQHRDRRARPRSCSRSASRP